MKRRTFVKNVSIASVGLLISKKNSPVKNNPVYGHHKMTYTLNAEWGNLNPNQIPLNDCHEMVQDSKGRIVLLTNETKNNVIVYNTSGKLIESWGHQFPGAHGLTIQHNGKEDFLFITDTNTHQVFKTTMDGMILLTINAPKDVPAYEKPEAFVPGKPTQVKFTLPDIAHQFKKGHRMMIQIQSTWFPLVDRNPQQFMNIYEAKDSDFKKATIKIYHDASTIQLPILK